MKLTLLLISLLLLMTFYSSYGIQYKERSTISFQSETVHLTPTYKNNLELGISDALIIQIVDMAISGFKGFTKSLFSAGNYKKLETTSEGIPLMFNLSYGRQLKPRLTVGGSISFMNLKYTTHYLVENENKVYSFYNTSDYFLMSGMLKYEYIKKYFFSLYGKGALGIGVLFMNSIENAHNRMMSYEHKGMFFSFQGVPIGISVGNRIGGYLEIGIGMQGLAQAGIFYKF